MALQSALNASPSSYPDLQRFGSVIVDNSFGINAECTAHGSYSNWQNYEDGDASAGGSIQTPMLQQYIAQNFSTYLSYGNCFGTYVGSGGAYAYIGALLHLVEDGTSPPHAGNILHGAFDGIEDYAMLHPGLLPPLAPPDTSTTTIFGFYKNAYANTAESLPGWTVGIPAALQSASPSWPSPENYWVGNANYDATQPSTRDIYRGKYGGGPSSGYPNLPFDIFNKSYPPSPGGVITYLIPPTDSIVTDQEKQAVELGAGMLQAASESLPSLVTNFSLSSVYLTTGTTIALDFTILENRTPDENYYVTVLTNPSDGSLPVFVSTIADDVPITLDQNTTPGSLPFSGEVTDVSWDGTVSGDMQPDGAYQFCVSVIDGDGNPSPGPAQGYSGSCQPFFIANNGPLCLILDVNKTPLFSVVESTNSVLISCSDLNSGICSIDLDDQFGDLIQEGLFDAEPTANFGPFSLSTGTYQAVAANCADTVSTTTFSIVSAAGTADICTTQYHCAGREDVDPSQIMVGTMTVTLRTVESNCQNVIGSDSACLDWMCSSAVLDCEGVGTPNCAGSCDASHDCATYQSCPYSSIFPSTFTITTSTNELSGLLTLYLYSSTGDYVYLANPSLEWGMYLGTSTGVVVVPQVGTTIPIQSADGVLTGQSYVNGVSVGNLDPSLAMLVDQLSGIYGQMGQVYEITDPAFVFKSPANISMSTAPPSGSSVNAATVGIYRFDGVHWSSAAVANQYISINGSVITATGTYTQSGDYALFYAGQDSSAPVTTASIQGPSSSFDGTVFLSTYSFIALSATDPVVNGFASQVKTTYYQIDAPYDSDSYAVYSNSIPIPLGAHSLSYYSVDYAGNIEAVHTSTYEVTWGTLFKDSANFTTAGQLLIGSQSYGVQLDVQSQLQNNYALLVSSPNYSTLFATTYLGSSGIGVSQPLGLLDIQGTGASGDIALQLRSGNSTSTSSVQGAFCFNASNTMCHALTTEHNSSADLGNRMDFWLWNSAVSTTTIGDTDLLAFQAYLTSTSVHQGAVHVMPVGNPSGQVNLVVSDGQTTGAGVIERAWDEQPSSRERKTDIRYLSEKESRQAHDDVMALRHASYRYKTMGPNGNLHPDPNQPLREGLIYEDSPKSIQGPDKSIVLDERIVNLELALQEDMKKLETLKKRLTELQQ